MANKQALDFSYLISMVGDDPDALIEVFESFLTQIPKYLAELDEAIINENWDKVTNSAHKIKPVFTYVGRSDVKDLVQRIENNANNRTELKSIIADIAKLKLFSAAINNLIEIEKEVQYIKMQNR